MINTKQKFILIAAILALIGAIIWGYSYITKIETDNISEPVAEEEKQSVEEELQDDVWSEVIWSKYINDELGFSIDIPDKVYGSYYCEPKKVIQVPVKVFEDNENGVVYISQEYHYQSKFDSELRKHVGECKKIILSKSNYSGWAIVIKTVENEDELDKFIKENYGSGCEAKDKKFWETDYNQSGVYDISVGGEGDNMKTNLGNTSCAGAWTIRYKVLYFPEKNKVMSVKLGQEPTFFNNSHTVAYDERMISSFRFK